MRKKIITSIAIVIVALVCCFGAYTMVNGQRVSAEQQAASRVEAEQQAVSDLQAVLDEKADDSLSEATGVDTARIVSDRDTVERIARAALTWNDFASYNESRQTILDMGVAADSQFMTEFMPEAATYTNGDGSEMNTIDSRNATTEFTSATTYCRGFDGDAYSYACVAIATSTSGSASDTATYIITCTLDGAGAISGVRAIQVN